MAGDAVSDVRIGVLLCLLTSKPLLMLAWFLNVFNDGTILYPNIISVAFLLNKSRVQNTIQTYKIFCSSIHHLNPGLAVHTSQRLRSSAFFTYRANFGCDEPRFSAS